MPVLRDFLPSRESDLLNWSKTFNQTLNLDPLLYGVSIEQAQEYNDLHQAFFNSYRIASSPETRTAGNIIVKNEKMKAVVAMARLLSRIIQANPNIGDDLKYNLGLTVRAKSVRKIDPPSEAPTVQVRSTAGYTIQIHLGKLTETTRRGRPVAAAGATVWTFVGDEAPSDRRDWISHGNTTKTTIDLHFPAKTPNGATIWITAAWYSRRGEFSPLSTPQRTNIPGGGVVARMSIAA